jgi:transcriptional regulator of heat shock response
MMNERQQEILKAVVEEYINRGEAISSGFLAGHYTDWDVSAATIRNELLELSDQGFLEQPHTSAGRIPTAEGYRFFVDNLLQEPEINKEQKDLFGNIENFFEFNDMLAQQSHTLVLGCKDPQEVHEAGLARLLDEPEFCDREFLTSFVQETERLRKQFDTLLDLIDDQPHIFIGQEAQQFAHDNRFSFLLTKIQDKGFAVFVSSTRTNYPRNLALARFLSMHDES